MSEPKVNRARLKALMAEHGPESAAAIEEVVAMLEKLTDAERVAASLYHCPNCGAWGSRSCPCTR